MKGPSSTGIVITGIAKSRGTAGTGTSVSNPIGRLGGIQERTAAGGPPSGSLRTNSQGAATTLESAAGSGLRTNAQGQAVNLESAARGSIDYNAQGELVSLQGSGNLGAITGNSGSITRPENRPTNLGATYGDSGSITRPENRPTNLGATYGDSGSITRPENRPTDLGATYGDSGAIDRGNNRPTGLGATYGDNGAINRDTNRPTNLGAVYGNSGAINRDPNRPGGLGATYGDSGAINRPGHIDTSLGAVRGNSGAINRSGSSSGSNALGSSSLRDGPRKVGGDGKKSKRRRSYKVRAAVHRDTCCGETITGEMEMVIHYGFDEFGNELPPKVVRWRAVIMGVDWTPENWQDYLWMESKLEAPETTTTATLIENTCGEELEDCANWALDAADPYGKLYGRQSQQSGLDLNYRVTPPIGGRGLKPVRMVLWPK